MQTPAKPRQMRKRYFLNDYYPSGPRLRVEFSRGGNRTIWTDKTTLSAMEQTKRWLDRLWA